MAIPVGLTVEAQKKLFLAIASSQQNISVEWSESEKQPMAFSNGRNSRIVLPTPSALDTELFWYYSFHELSHVLNEMLWSYDELQARLNFKDELVKAVANILMDNLTERNIYGRYERIDYFVDKGRTECSLEDIKGMKLTGEPVKDLLQALITAMMTERLQWQHSPYDCLDVSPLRKEFAPWLEKLEGLSLETRLHDIMSVPGTEAAKCESLVLDILELIGYKPEPPPPQEGQDGGQGGDKGENGEEQQGKSNGEGKEGEEKDGEQREGEQSKEGNESNDKEMGHTEVDPPAPLTQKGGNGVKLTQEEIKKMLHGIDKLLSDPIHDTSSRKVKEAGRKYIPFKNNKVEDLSLIREVENGYRGNIETALGRSTVSKQVQKYLQTQDITSYAYGKKTGKIHSKNVHRVYSVHDNQQPRIFKRKESSRLEKDTAVTLLLDCSGSMSGSKYSIGAACVTALNETLSALQIEHEIIGFSAEYNTLLTYVFKPYGKRFTRDKMINTLSSSKVAFNSNCDGDSLLYATERLLQRKEQKKICIVLSDGEPCGAADGNGSTYLKEVAKMVEQRTPIDLVGIGIATNSVQKYYKHNVVVRNPSELDAVLFRVLKEFLV